MRLTCPNCGAQYEVPGDVIPETGRDVQCSNCGDTWFQPHPDHPRTGTQDSDEGEGRTGAAPKDETPSEGAAQQNDAAKIDDADASEADIPADEDAASEVAESGPPAPHDPPQGRREIDPGVASVLREEAEREKRARAAAQQGALETQPDLGLGEERDGDRRARETRARLSGLRGGAAAHQTQTPGRTDPAAADSLFPDIEEINSSLAPAGPPAGDAEGEGRTGLRGGFRRGFLIAVLIAVLALLTYMFAPQLSEMMPALRGALADYAAWVDDLRQWLDGQIAALMLWLDGMASTAPAGAPAG